MRSILRSLLPLALVLAVPGCKKDKDANERRVVILFTTDEHSQLFASSPELDDFLGTPVEPGALEGGVARRMTVLQAQRDAAAARGAATLTLSSGDFSQGSLASAAWVAQSPELAMMWRMGYDAVALGNHEFDLGPAALAAAVEAAGTEVPPLVITNITFSAASAADDGLAALYGTSNKIAPYRILSTSNGLRVGIVASMGVSAGTVAGSAPPVTFFSGADNTARFGSVVAALQGAVDTVRRLGVDAVILLAHGGIGATPAAPGEDELLALQLKHVDLILSGHSHLFTPEPRIVYGSGTAVPVVQPKPYGRNVGKVELVFTEDGDAPRPYLDPAGTRFLDVDDRTARTTDPVFLTDLQTRTVGFLEFGLDGAATTLPSFLESTLSKVTGTTLWADPLNAGSLWNKPLGQLDYEVIGLAPGETNAMNLDTDAMLDGVRQAALIGLPPAACASCAATELAIQASGPIRGDLKPGTTGAIGFAEVYHVVPLGGDPTALAPADMNPETNPVGMQAYLNAVPGYPLVKVNIPTAALKAALEGTLSTGLFVNGDFFPGVSGLDVEYGLTVNPASPTVIKYMALADGTVLYDAADPAYTATGGYAVSPTSFRSLATTLYIAAVAQALGIPMYDDAFQQLTTTAQLAAAIVRRGDGSAMKDFESFAQYVAGACAGNGGFLPAEYGAAVPRRTVCTGPGCPAGY